MDDPSLMYERHPTSDHQPMMALILLWHLFDINAPFKRIPIINTHYFLQLLKRSRKTVQRINHKIYCHQHFQEIILF